MESRVIDRMRNRWFVAFAVGVMFGLCAIVPEPVAADILGQKNSTLTLGTDYSTTNQFRIVPGEQALVRVGLKNTDGTSVTATITSTTLTAYINFLNADGDVVTSAAMNKVYGRTSAVAVLTSSTHITSAVRKFVVIVVQGNNQAVWGPAAITVPQIEAPDIN